MFLQFLQRACLPQQQLCQALPQQPTAVSSDYARDNSYTKAAEDIDAQYAYSGNDLGVTYTKDATTFKVWSPTATDVKVNMFAKG